MGSGCADGWPWQGSAVGACQPEYITEELDIQCQYANNALGDLATAGWVQRLATELYEFIEDPPYLHCVRLPSTWYNP